MNVNPGDIVVAILENDYAVAEAIVIVRSFSSCNILAILSEIKKTSQPTRFTYTDLVRVGNFTYYYNSTNIRPLTTELAEKYLVELL